MNSLSANTQEDRNFTRSDITFYIAGTVEERVQQLLDEPSPLKLDQKIHSDHYILNTPTYSLDGSFSFLPIDSENMREPLHRQTQRDLQFKAKSCLYYPGCNPNLAKAIAFKTIMNHLSTKRIPAYMALRDEDGEETLVRGYNPITGTTLTNPLFAERTPYLIG